MFRFRHLPRLVPRALLLAACVSGAARAAAAQQAVTATSGSPRAIAEIRARFAEIEREAPRLRRTRHDLQNFSLEGGELEGFYRGGELRKLKARLYGETWQGTEEYYFSSGRLIFVHLVQNRYEEPMSGIGKRRIEHRFYFDGGRLIRLVRSQHPRATEDLSMFDPELPTLLRNAELFAACAAGTGPEPPACTAPER
jgi:hypothetical protein